MLREARSSDALELATYHRDSRYLEHYGDRLDAERIVRLACEWAAASPRLNYQLIIALARDGQVLGCAGLRQAGYPIGEAEVGIELNPLHWGVGYAVEALGELIRFGQQGLGITRLWAVTTPNNRRAHRLLGRLNFSPEPPSSCQAASSSRWLNAGLLHRNGHCSEDD